MAKAKHVLNVTGREANGSGEARRVRAKGLIPAVIYSKGTEPKNVAVNASEWESLQKYEFNLVTLEFGDKSETVLVKDTQKNFIKGKTSHIDFLAVDRSKPIIATVPIHQGHTAPAGLAEGGLLEQYVHEVEVECLPDDLPEAIVADISGLGVDQSFHVSNLTAPEKVTIKTHGDITLFRVINPLEIKEDIPAAAAAADATADAAAEPEVVGEKEKAERAAAREEEKAAKK